MRAVTHGSLFSGIGGFDLAADRCGYDTRWHVEIEPFCRRVLAKHWPRVRRYGDIRTVSGTELEPVDVVTGGFPCQGLSVAGRREGLGDPRSGLFFELIRVVRELREASSGSAPAFLVLENVPGLLSSERGRDFAMVLRSLAELGPVELAWRILDARWWGVPQRRRRVFLVADFGGRRAAQVLALAESGRRHPAPGRAAGMATARCLRGSPSSRSTSDDPDRVTLVPEVAYTLAGGAGPRRLQHEQTYVVYGFDHTQDPVSARNAVPTLNHDGQAVAYQCHGSNVGPLGTLRQGNGALTGGVPFLVNGSQVAVRRLTPTEAERCFGLPDGHTCLCGVTPYNSWTCRCPDGPRYRALGNAVVTTVAEWLLGRIAPVCQQEARG